MGNLVGNKAVLTVEYEGTAYHGFQWQRGLPTIQGEFESAITKLTGEKRRVVSASRTDAGVHAKEQVVCFRSGCGLAEDSLVTGLNHFLPDDISVKKAWWVGEGFNVQKDPVRREYSYRIWLSSTRAPLRQRFCHVISGSIDIVAISRACGYLEGEHDFASFASDMDVEEPRSTVRRVYRAGVSGRENLIVFNIMASAFLRHQVRNTVGVLLTIGRGRAEPEVINRLIAERRFGLAGPQVPARGLCLVKVSYPGNILE
ncbi:tRNA pseudouridine(38-40) synthase TruA [Chloroflexota bacterium]